MKPNIVVVGSANRDLVIKADRIPAPGETVGGGLFVSAPGGKGANQAVAAARLGGDVSFVGCVGADAFGDSLTAEMAAAGVHIGHVRHDPAAATGVALIAVDAAGQNAIVVAPGANHCVTPADIDAAGAEIATAAALVVQLEIPLAAVEAAVAAAVARGVRVILNPAPMRGAGSLSRTMLAAVDVLVPNEHEAAMLLGQKEPDAIDWSEAASQLREMVAGAVVITLGREGCVVADGAGVRQIAACPVQSVDTTAAGDCFIGALAVGLADGLPLDDAARFATRAAALSVTRMGAQPSLPTRAELDAVSG